MRLRWTKLTSQYLDDIAEYIGQDSPAAACRVVLELMERAESALVAHPAKRNAIFAPDAAAFGHVPACRGKRGVDMFGAGFGFIHSVGRRSSATRIEDR